MRVDNIKLIKELHAEIARIYNDAVANGVVDEDAICDELGDFYERVNASTGLNGDVIKQAYALARGAQEEDYDVAVSMLRKAKALTA